MADIAKGEIVMIKGGHIVSRDFVEREVTPRLGPVEIQIGDDLFIAPVTQEEREGSMLYSNHSCDPNLGLRGNIIFVGLRDIRAGEELTHDWVHDGRRQLRNGMQMRLTQLPSDSYRQRLAAAGTAGTLSRLFRYVPCR